MEVLLSLVQNFDVFAWSLYKVLGVDLAFITHKLNVDALVPPKKHKPRRSVKPYVEAMKDEVDKLKQAEAILPRMFVKYSSGEKEK